MEKIEQIKLLFNKIKQGHDYWVKGDNAFKERITKALGPTIDELEVLGVARHFSESLLFFGKEFVDSVVLGSADRQEASVEDAEAIFGATAVDMTDREKREAQIASKHNIIAYRPISGETPKIEALIKGKTPQTQKLL